jgi:DNA repair protein RadD
MPPQELRPYQANGVRQIMDAYRGGASKVLAVSPTGSGKTTLFGFLVHQLAAAGHGAAILVHRRELATQACNRLLEFGTDFGLIMAGEPSKPYARVQVASVQTLVRRLEQSAEWIRKVRLVVCDEAHLSTAETWQKVLALFPHARILGVTATPWRLGGKPLAGAYDASVVIATSRDLREQGHLCDYVGFSYLTPDLSDVKTTGGDYNERESAAAMSQSVIVDNVVEQWLAHARELSTVVFAVTVEHSKQLTEKFQAAGVAAEHLDGATPLEQRRAILKRVDQGVTRVLCNVGVAVEGLDIPRLKCCVLARPTKSLARAIQMMGRVRRPWQGVTARIHDHAFVIRQHGLPDAERDYKLHAKPEAPPSLSQCPDCLAYFDGPACTLCGKVPEVRVSERRELATVADAEQYDFTSATEEAPERNDKPVVIRWDKPGRVVEGRLARTWDERTDFGTQRRYLLRGTKRDYELPGTAHLNALMSRVQIPDSMLRVTYVQEQPLSGGRVRKVFKLEIDDDQPAPKGEQHA